MKGLFVKDLKLMMLQKNFLLLILAIVIGMMIFTDDVIFPLGFLSFIVSLFTVSTISYDDFDNGNAFLLPKPKPYTPIIDQESIFHSHNDYV